MKSFCCKSTCSVLPKRPFIKYTLTLSVSLKKQLCFTFALLQMEITSSDWCNMREYVLSTAFKLKLQSVTHLSKSCEYCLDPRRSSMCFQPTVTCVIANCLLPVFFLRVWHVAGADVQAQVCSPDSWKTVRSVSIAMYHRAVKEQIVLLMLQSKFGMSEECFIVSEDWQQSRFFIVNTNYTVALFRREWKNVQYFTHESGQQDHPCSQAGLGSSKRFGLSCNRVSLRLSGGILHFDESKTRIIMCLTVACSFSPSSGAEWN